MWTPGGRRSRVLRYSVMTEIKPVKYGHVCVSKLSSKVPELQHDSKGLFINVSHAEYLFTSR